MTKVLRALAVFLAAVPATAGNIKLGPIALNPYYGVEARYEDNIYRVPRDINHHAVTGGGVRGSWIVSNNLGLKLAAPIGEMHKVSAFGDVVFENYKVQPRANNAINHKAGAGYELKGSKLSAKLSEEYINTQDPAFNPNGTVIHGSLVRRERRWQNTAAASLEYALGEKFFAGIDGQTVRHQYLNGSGGAASLANTLNRSEVVFGGKAGYKIAPKTRIFMAVHRTLLHYTEETRQDNHRDWQGDLGVEGQLSAKLKGLIQGGFTYVHFDYDTGNSTRKRVTRQASGLIKLDYAMTERDQVILAANRATNDSPSTNSRYFVSIGANLAYNHKFSKVTAGLTGGVQQDKYSESYAEAQAGATKTRRDDNYTGGAKLEYKATDWFSMGATYTHSARFSTFSRQFNFKDNVSAINAKFNF